MRKANHKIAAKWQHYKLKRTLSYDVVDLS